MAERLGDIFDGRSLLILGYGKEGKSTYKTIRRLAPGYPLGLSDRDPGVFAADKQIGSDKNVRLYSGDNYLDPVLSYDLIIKSPGISPQLFHRAVDKSNITSQTDLFINEYRSQIIGVTGTKGKSTTSSLICHILKQQDDDVVLTGNIGLPPFDSIQNIGKNTKIVFELSSHQLEFMTVSPAYAVFLNIFQEHLDHYITYEKYQQAKLNIARYQKSADWLIFNNDDETLKGLLQHIDLKAALLPYSSGLIPNQGCFSDGKHIIFKMDGRVSEVVDLSDKRLLKGRHNELNIMAAVCICKLFGLPEPLIRSGISTFQPLEHRLEYVGRYHEIHFFNDSIATIPEATIAAVNALVEVQTLILGGMDRGIDYSVLLHFLISSTVKNLVFLGKAGKRMHDEYLQLNPEQSLTLAKDFDEAVGIAIAMTTPGGTCLLSPAAASYDMFRNFEERGKRFKTLVSIA